MSSVEIGTINGFSIGITVCNTNKGTYQSIMNERLKLKKNALIQAKKKFENKSVSSF